MKTKNLLGDSKSKTFGNKTNEATSRQTVVAVIFDPSSDTYLCQYWEEYSGLTCLLSGGIEDDEDSYEALRREIREETGYIDFDIIGILGGTLNTYYVKGSTGESLVKHITPYLVRLNSSRQIETTKEEDERFENLFLDHKNINELMTKYEKNSGSTLADHKEILSRAVRYLNQ